MAFRLVSDLHLEFFNKDDKFILPELSTDKEDVLVLAGDIGLADRPKTYVPYITKWSTRFKKIIYVLGNHEFYKTSFLRAQDKMEEELEHLDNVYVGTELIVRDGGVTFVCATLWTDFNNHNPMDMASAQFGLNDYKQIRTGDSVAPYSRKLSPNDTFNAHQQAIKFIEKSAKKEKNDGNRVVIITHHLPSYASVPEAFRGDPINSAYASSLDDIILDLDIDVWAHGHTHNSFAYEIGETAVVCNPHGYYPDETNPEFNSQLRITLKEEL